MNVIMLWMWSISVIWTIISYFLLFEGDVMNTIIAIVIMITIGLYVTISNGIFEKPNIYKKHTKKCYNSTKYKNL